MMRRAAASFALLFAAAFPLRAQDAPQRNSEPPPPSTVSALKALPETLGDAIGTWDMSLDGSNRRCEVSLSGDSGSDGRVLRFPAGCRRALPVLADAAGWLFADKTIRIVDRNVRPLIEFSPRPDAGSLVGKAERGGTYSLVPLQTVAMLPSPEPLSAVDPASADAAPSAAGPSDAPTVANAREIPGSQPVLRADVLAWREVAARSDAPAHPDKNRGDRPASGTYALDRFNEKDVCRIALESRPATPNAERNTFKDIAPARILPGCRDSGIAVFDPVSWRFISGHLTLKARRGHAINLVPAGDGLWRRDPDTGTTLVLRKVEP